MFASNKEKLRVEGSEEAQMPGSKDLHGLFVIVLDTVNSPQHTHIWIFLAPSSLFQGHQMSPSLRMILKYFSKKNIFENFIQCILILISSHPPSPRSTLTSLQIQFRVSVSITSLPPFPSITLFLPLPSPPLNSLRENCVTQLLLGVKSDWNMVDLARVTLLKNKSNSLPPHGYQMPVAPLLE